MELELIENKINKKSQKLTNKKEFKLQGKNFFLTYPQCELTREQALECLQDIVDIQYACIGQELHIDGARHLHILVSSKKKLTVRNQKFFDLLGHHGNYQTARDSDDVRKYVMKEDLHPLEHGQYIGNNQSHVQKIAMENKILLSKPLHELVDTGEVSLHNYTKLSNAINQYKLDKVEVKDYQPRRCLWIYGDTGIGKSRYVRTTYPQLHYSKAMNKWWDGYKQETVVLIDDFDSMGACLGHYLKIWADCYSFNAEVKGATIVPVFDTLIITSQYLPKDIWATGQNNSKMDWELVKAIQRRFIKCTVEAGILIEMEWD